MHNECPSVKLEDGPILNKFCKDKQMCMNDVRYVFLTQVVVKIFREGIEWLLSSYILMIFFIVILIIFMRK
jgi:hypothetical protein